LLVIVYSSWISESVLHLNSFYSNEQAAGLEWIKFPLKSIGVLTAWGLQHWTPSHLLYIFLTHQIHTHSNPAEKRKQVQILTCYLTHQIHTHSNPAEKRKQVQILTRYFMPQRKQLHLNDILSSPQIHKEVMMVTKDCLQTRKRCDIS
jgi:hypothetical protein